MKEMNTTNIYPISEAIEILKDQAPPTIHIYSQNKQETIDIIDIAIRLQYSILFKKGTNVFGLVKKVSSVGGGN